VSKLVLTAYRLGHLTAHHTVDIIDTTCSRNATDQSTRHKWSLKQKGYWAVYIDIQ